MSDAHMTGAPKLLLDFQELADTLGVTLATIYRWKAKGELPLPILRLGRGPRVRTVDVEAWLERLAEEADFDQQRRTPAGDDKAGVRSIQPVRRGRSRAG